MLDLIPGKLYIVQDTIGRQDGVYLSDPLSEHTLIPSEALVMYVGYYNLDGVDEGDVFMCPDGRLRGWGMDCVEKWERFLRPV